MGLPLLNTYKLMKSISTCRRWWVWIGHKQLPFARHLYRCDW